MPGPRIRTLKPEIFQHRKLGPLADRTKLLFIGLITQADDDGRGHADLPYLKATLWPYHPVALPEIDAALTQLEALGLVRRYLGPDHAPYFDLPSWKDHQRIDRPKPSLLPAFSNGSRPRRVAERSSTHRANASGIRSDQNRSDQNGPDQDQIGSEQTPPAPPAGGATAAWGTPEALLAMWHREKPEECPRVQEFDAVRRQKARAALQTHPDPAWWQPVFQHLRESRFLRGLEPPGPGRTKPFKADFDWLLGKHKDGNQNRVLVYEGHRYENDPLSTLSDKSRRSVAAGQAWLDKATSKARIIDTAPLPDEEAP